jgi:two-component system response regulator DegU
MRILIVEDNARMRSLLRSMLSAEGTEFCECPRGEDALTEFRTFQPDLVLMDIRMGGMDGIDATALIRREDASATVVIVTEYDDDDYRAQARRAGAREYFLKRNLLDVREFVRKQVRSRNGN